MFKSAERKRSQGFTLAEVLIVVAIIGILLAVAIPNVISYYRSLKLTELDDSAKTIFMAAQSRLTAMTSAGQDLYDLSDIYVAENAGGGTGKYLAVTSEQADRLASLVPGGSIESQLYDNHYVVEIDPKTGAVYAVWYWEKEDFKYTSDAYVKVPSDKGERLKKGAMVGYYGGSEINRPDLGQMPIPQLTVINAEELRLDIKLPLDDTSGLDNSKIRVSVTISDSEGHEKTVIKGAGLDGSADANNPEGSLVLDTLKPDDYYKTITEGAPLKDIGDKFKNWVNGSGIIPGIIPGDDINVTVVVSYLGTVKIKGKDTSLVSQSASVRTNSLFASVKDDGGDKVAEIAYGRHLQNLDNDEFGITKAVQTRTIDFMATVGVGEDTIYYWNSIYGHDTVKFSPINTFEIDGLYDKHDLTEYDGGNFEIRNLNIKNPYTDPTEKANASLGLFGSIYDHTGTKTVKLENIVLVNTKAEDGGKVGALAGELTDGEINNCHVYLDEFDSDHLADKDPRFKGKVAVGGLVGSVNSTNFGIKIENCSAATVISGTNNAGGLVGVMSAGDCVIINSYAACNITGAYVGGLVGRSEDTEIKNSYAAGTADVIGGGVATSVSGLFNYSNAVGGVLPVVAVENSYAAVLYGTSVTTPYGAYRGAGTGGSAYYVKQTGVNYQADSGEAVSMSKLKGMIGDTTFTKANGWYVPEGGSMVNPSKLTYPYNTLGTALTDPYPYPMLQKKLTDDDGNLIVDIVDEHGNPIAVGPGVTFPMEHYGDWLEDNVAAMPIYWESYWDNDADADNGEYGFYGPDGEINSLKAEKPGTEDAIVKADGIAVFVPLGMDAPKELTVYRQLRQRSGSLYHGEMGPKLDVPEKPSLYVAVNAAGKTTLFNYDETTDTATPRDPGGVIGSGDARYACYILDLSPLKLEENAERDKTISGFYMELRDEETDISLWCNPFFPCEVLAAEPEDLTTMPLEKKNVAYYDKTGALQSYTGTDVLLRSPRHLNDLVTYTQYIDRYMKSGEYSESSGNLVLALRQYHYLQTADIDYAKYDTSRFTTVRTGQDDATRQIGIWLVGKYDPSFNWDIGDGGYTGNRYLIKNAFLSEGLFYIAAGTIDGLRLVNTSVKCVDAWTSTHNSCTGGTVARNGANVHFIDCGAYSETAELYEERCVELESYNATGGGFVGEASSSGWYENCFAAVKVTVRAVSDGYAGGFAGCSSPANQNVLVYNNCYAGGHTVNGMYDAKNPNVTLTVLEDDTVRWEYGDMCVAGFMGILENKDQFTLLGTNYSTCSVGLYHVERTKPYGYACVGPFLTSGYNPQDVAPTTDANTACYSTAAIYDENGDLFTKETFTARGSKCYWLTRYPNEAQVQEECHLVDFTACAATQAAGFDTRPYDDVLKDMTYPYKTDLSAHYGDWPLLKPMLVYYEKYNDDTYGYYSVTCKGTTFTDTINTLHVGKPGDGVTVVEDGYRFLAPFDMDLGGGSAVTKDGDFPTVVNGCVAYKIEGLTIESLAGYGGSDSPGRYRRSEWISANFTYGGKTYVFWCNPCYACEAFDMTEAAQSVSNSGQTQKVNIRYIDKTTGSETTRAFSWGSKIIRSPRHLGIATIDPDNGGNRTWYQLLDIDYATYTAPLTYGEAKKGANTTVGKTKETPQRPLCLGYLKPLEASEYYGNRYLIKNLYIEPCEEKAEGATSDDYFVISAGVFTIQNGCTVDGVRLVNVNVTGTKNVGGLAGACEDNGKIIDCGIYVDSADDYEKFTVTGTGDNVGGLVGYLFKRNLAECPVKNSFAAVKVTGKNYVGGLVGRAENKAVITDCYAGGHTVDGEYVGADANVTGNDYVGGLLGYVTINRTNYTNGAKIISSYSTASVRSMTATAESPTHLGALIGDGPTTYGYDYDSTTISSLYARNKVFDKDGNVVDGRTEPYLRPVKDVLVRNADDQKTAYPYDNTLGDKFPYYTRLTEHHGDWPEPPKGQLVYWEQCGTEYGTGKPAYLFYGGENSEINCLPGADHEVTLDGYGILVPAGKEVPEVFVPDYSSDPLELELLSEASFRGKNYDLYGFKLPMKTFTGSGDYYHRIYVVADELWFNPDFACEVYATQPADLTKPAAKTLTEYGTAIPLTGGESGYVIRSARQLVNKAKYSGLHDKIYQWMNIDFATYDAGTVRFYATPVDGQSEDSPYSQPMRLLSGGAYTCHGFDTGPGGGSVTNPGERALEIRNLYIGGQAGSYVNAIGLFDHVGDVDPDNPAILKNLHLVNVDVSGDGSQDSSVGGLAGTVSGAAKIENCGIYVSSADDYDNFTIQGGGQSQYVGGLFGYINQSGGAQPVLENCFAAVKVVSGSRMWTSTGGFAGNASYCTIKNCYSGGHTVNGKYVDTVREDANVVERGSNPSGTGGFLGTSRDVTFEGVCYSTCSVYGKSYDGYTGALIGHAYTDPTLAPGATVYATGKAVTADGGKTLRNESYLSPALTTAPTSGTARAARYDTTLTYKYPYQVAEGQTVHHGDWYIPDIGAAFYWEKEQVYRWNATQSTWVAEGDPDYRYHLMGVSELSEEANKYLDVNTLCTEHHDDGKIHQIDDYGYGFLTINASNGTINSDMGLSYHFNKLDAASGTGKALRDIIEAKLGCSTKWFEIYSANKEMSYNGKCHFNVKLLGNGASRTVYFGTSFADLMEKLGNTFTIRAARQLDNIKDYNKTYVQAHDVGAVGYDSYTAPNIQDVTYNGQSYRILELNITSNDDVALFKIARGTNTLENMVLYSPSGKARIEATDDQKAAGGLIAYLDVDTYKDGWSTTIENCAVAGYTFYTPRNTAGGLVGYANHNLTITSCEAVNTFERRYDDSISTKDNPLGIGGLVGPVGNGHDAFPSLTIEKSYAGGKITGNSTVGSVGGLYGGGRAPNGGTIQNAYSYMNLSACWMDTSNLNVKDEDYNGRYTVNTRKEVNTIGHGATGSHLYYYDKSSYLPDFKPKTAEAHHEWDYQGEGNGQGKATSDLGSIPFGTQPVKTYVPGSTGLKALDSQTGIMAVVKDADGNCVHYGELPTP